MTSMNDLNNDCLREILLYIEVDERIKFRQVSKKWRGIVDDCWRAAREIVIIDGRTQYGLRRKKAEVTGRHHVVRIKTSGQKLIEGVMRRCGDIVTSLLESRDEKNNSGLPHAIKYCHNLERLDTTVRTKVDDKNTSHLLAVNKELKFLHLKINFKNAKGCLRKVPTDYLECLDLVACSMDHASPVILIGQKMVISRCSSSLRKLSVDYFDDELLKLIGQKKTLGRLGLRFFYANGATQSGLYHVLELKNLRRLQLDAANYGKYTRFFQTVTDDFLMALAENLPLLEVIELEGPMDITNEGFKSLASVRKLRKLRMTDFPKVTDEFLVLFSGLEELGVGYCPIRDEGVIKLLEKAQTMQSLNLENSLITNNTLVAAVNATKKRDNGMCLTLYNTGTDTDPEALTETSPLLKIVDHDDW